MAISTSTGNLLANLAARGNLKALRDFLLEMVSLIVGQTAGTVTASQAVIVSATKTIGTFLSITATTFVGNLTGNVTGNVTGLLALTRSTIAAAGSTNADATQAALGIVTVTGADGTKGVLLPVPAAGSLVLVKNNTAAVLKVYPGTGAAINALTATSGAISMASLTSAIFMGDSATQWFTIPLLPS